jgi:uncharacterized protein YaaQ
MMTRIVPRLALEGRPMKSNPVILCGRPSWKGNDMNPARLDCLAILTVSGSQFEALMKSLRENGFQFTIMNSSGGVVQEAQVSILVGFRQKRYPMLLDLVSSHCKSYRRYIPAQGFMPGAMADLPMVEAQLGGALIHVMSVDYFEQF